MPLLLSYCLKLSLSLVLIWLFYQLMLRKLTFYNWNRYYLLGYSLLSFFVAFIDISPVLQQQEWSDTHALQWIPVLSGAEIVSRETTTANFFTPANITAVLMVSGIFVMCIRFLFQFVSFVRLKKRAEFISIDGMKFYQVNDSIIPFSFGNSIFINRHLHTEDEMKEIIRHEFVHVKQKHSVDIIWAEVLCILNWYSPFAWLIRASIRQNLEFIADNKVLATGISKKEYQYLLLKVIGNNQFSIAPNFNFYSLKKRIAMMNKFKSARMNLVRFLFILPLIAAMLLAFRSVQRESLTPTKYNTAVHSTTEIFERARQLADTVPPKKSTKPVVANNEKVVSALSDYFEIMGDRAIIHLKNGTTEEYDLKNKEERKKLEEKYSKIINVIEPPCPTNTVSAVTVDGLTTVISPVKVANSVSSTVATSTSVSVSATVATPIATPSDVKVTTVISPTPVTTTNTVLTVDDDGSIINGKEETLFVLTKNTTRQQLEELTKQMKEKGFDLSFKDIKYNDDGKLASISGTIKSKDVTGSFAVAAFNKVVVSVITDGDHTYLRVEEVVKRVI
jgi:bla regulator protein blaR1